ncbi:hypothetical protein FT663_02331 [Candidozyma haemuli var. vulneris]|nr:hypothetical protein FT662_02503 [[Candida] haemuloni var. vulneris]KAF3992404.1 hypothetical protein FT663_02331 [[Candida] haemuloni var. vulneris]
MEYSDVCNVYRFNIEPIRDGMKVWSFPLLFHLPIVSTPIDSCVTRAFVKDGHIISVTEASTRPRCVIELINPQLDGVLSNPSDSLTWLDEPGDGALVYTVLEASSLDYAIGGKQIVTDRRLVGGCLLRYKKRKFWSGFNIKFQKLNPLRQVSSSENWSLNLNYHDPGKFYQEDPDNIVTPGMELSDFVALTLVSSGIQPPSISLQWVQVELVYCDTKQIPDAAIFSYSDRYGAITLLDTKCDEPLVVSKLPGVYPNTFRVRSPYKFLNCKIPQVGPTFSTESNMRTYFLRIQLVIRSDASKHFESLDATLNIEVACQHYQGRKENLSEDLSNQLVGLSEQARRDVKVTRKSDGVPGEETSKWRLSKSLRKWSKREGCPIADPDEQLMQTEMNTGKVFKRLDLPVRGEPCPCPVLSKPVDYLPDGYEFIYGGHESAWLRDIDGNLFVITTVRWFHRRSGDANYTEGFERSVSYDGFDNSGLGGYKKSMNSRFFYPSIVPTGDESSPVLKATWVLSKWPDPILLRQGHGKYFQALYQYHCLSAMSTNPKRKRLIDNLAYPKLEAIFVGSARYSQDDGGRIVVSRMRVSDFIRLYIKLRPEGCECRITIESLAIGIDERLTLLSDYNPCCFSETYDVHEVTNAKPSLTIDANSEPLTTCTVPVPVSLYQARIPDLLGSAFSTFSEMSYEIFFHVSLTIDGKIKKSLTARVPIIIAEDKYDLLGLFSEAPSYQPTG